MNFHQYPSFLILLGIVLGIALGIPSTIFFVSIVLCICLSICALWVKSKKISIAYLRNLGIVLLAYLSAAFWADIRQVKNMPEWYGHHLEDDSYLKLNILSKASEKEKTIHYQAEVITVINNEYQTATKGVVNVYFYKSEENKDLAYRTILVPNKLVPISASGNPFSFNYASYLAHLQQYHQLFLSFEDVIYQSAKINIPLIEQWRNALLSTLAQNIPDTITQTLAQTVLLNERKGMDAQIQDAYSKTGIVHIVAISGMHITILLGILMYLLFFIKHRKYDWLKYLIALPVVWIYIILTHAPASAVRAGVMFSIVCGAIVILRYYNNINTLFVTAIIMLMYNTNWLYDVGMQLSFLCMLSIFIFYKPIKELLHPKNRLVILLWDVLAMSIAVQILVAPLVVYYFYQFPLFTFLANIPAAIYSTIFLIGILIIAVLGSLGINMLGVGYLISWLTYGFNHIIIALSSATPEAFSSIYIDKYGLILLTLGISIAVAGWLIYTKKTMINIGLLCIIAFMIHNIMMYYQQSEQKQLIFYNINNTNIAALISSHKYVQISPDSISSKDYNFNIKPSLVRLQISDFDTIPTNIYSYQGKIFYNLNIEINYQNKPDSNIHTLIVSDYSKHTIGAIQIIQPQRVILTSKLKRWQAQKLATILGNEYEVHNIHTDGAFIE